MRDILTFSDLANFLAQSDLPKEEKVAMLVSLHNELQDMRYGWLPFGKKLAKTQYIIPPSPHKGETMK